MSNLLLKPAIFLCCCIVPGWLLIRWKMHRRAKITGAVIPAAMEILLISFLVYTSLVLELTIVPASISGISNPPEPALNAVPVMNTYKQFMATLAEASSTDMNFALENIIGNIILFLPLGIFLPCISPAVNSTKKVAVICLCCSFSIELVQFLLRKFGTYRTVDIDDVILNTAGGLLGWLIFDRLLRRHPFLQKHIVK